MKLNPLEKIHIYIYPPQNKTLQRIEHELKNQHDLMMCIDVFQKIIWLGPVEPFEVVPQPPPQPPF